MSTYPPPPPPGTPPPGGVGRRLEEAMELIEMELRHAAAYVNDAVIPQVRRESICAMRAVAETLKNMADRMDRNAGPGAAGAPGGPAASGGFGSTGPSATTPGSGDPRT